MTYLGLQFLALPVFSHSSFVSIPDKGSVPEITLSDASILASTLYFLIGAYMYYLLKYLLGSVSHIAG